MRLNESLNFNGGGGQACGRGFHRIYEPTHPVTPSLSPTGGEGVRRTGEGAARRFMGPMHGIEVGEALQETGKGESLPGKRKRWGGRRDLNPRQPDPQS